MVGRGERCADHHHHSHIVIIIPSLSAHLSSPLAVLLLLLHLLLHIFLPSPLTLPLPLHSNSLFYPSSSPPRPPFLTLRLLIPIPIPPPQIPLLSPHPLHNPLPHNPLHPLLRQPQLNPLRNRPIHPPNIRRLHNRLLRPEFIHVDQRRDFILRPAPSRRSRRRRGRLSRRIRDGRLVGIRMNPIAARRLQPLRHPHPQVEFVVIPVPLQKRFPTDLVRRVRCGFMGRRRRVSKPVMSFVFIEDCFVGRAEVVDYAPYYVFRGGGGGSFFCRCRWWFGRGVVLGLPLLLLLLLTNPCVWRRRRGHYISIPPLADKPFPAV